MIDSIHRFNRIRNKIGDDLLQLDSIRQNWRRGPRNPEQTWRQRDHQQAAAREAGSECQPDDSIRLPQLRLEECPRVIG